MIKKIIKRRAVDPVLLKENANLYPALGRILASRGCKNLTDLEYNLRDILAPNLKDIDKACDLLVTAIDNKERILIVGDFDVDGATSTTVAIKCLRMLGATHVDFIVPNRFEFGYGLTPEIIDHCEDKNPDLIITVDNGISSIEGVNHAKAKGIKVLITDHHLPGETTPSADALVNPNQKDCPFPAKSTAGVGVIFYVMLALRNRLRELGRFDKKKEPNMAEILDLVALGTVADVVPLEPNNRILVSHGLKRMTSGKVCHGIKALMAVAGKNIRNMGSSDLGFSIAPRLNAAGRLDDMTLGIRCLLSESYEEALDIANKLDSLNVERRSIEEGMQKEAEVILEKMESDLQGKEFSALCLYGPDWHQGVIGILASRIKDRLHKPVIVFAEDKDGELKGSGRSIPGVHLRDTLDIIATSNPGMLEKFGGHAMAAGLSLDKNKLPEFEKALSKAVEEQLGSSNPVPVIETDGPLESNLFTINFSDLLTSYGPWGQAFPEPQFDNLFEIVDKRIIGGKHLKFSLSPVEDSNILVDAIIFNTDVEYWSSPIIKKINAVYKLNVNEFRGQRRLQLMLEYIEPV